MRKLLLSLFIISVIGTALPLTLQATGNSKADGGQTIHKAESSHIETGKKAATGEHETTGDKGHHAPHLNAQHLSLVWIIPFIGILLSIALFPLIAPHFWHHHYGKVSLFWWVAFFAAFTLNFGPDTSFFYLLEVYLLEFIPFIVLLVALFAVAGGIQLKGHLAGSPVVNSAMLLIGGSLASLMGTTGAAMVMIRPLIKANEWRKYKTHLVVFLIFIVANIGGALTPLGDPPLFLGFLKGVDFFWTTEHMMKPMLVAIGMLIVIFFIMDTYYYRKEPGKPEKNSDPEPLRLVGIPNIFLLPCIVLAVLASSMKLGDAFTIHYVAVPTASLLQVMLLLAITVVSIIITKREIRISNGFNWEPILEVAKLFSTIFITMVPAIAMLKSGPDGRPCGR